MESSRENLEEIILKIRQTRDREIAKQKDTETEDSKTTTPVFQAMEELREKIDEQNKTIESLETLVKEQKETIKKLEGLESAFYHLDVFIREKDASIEKLKEEKSGMKEIVSNLEERNKMLEENNKKLGDQSKKIEVLEEENEIMARDIKEYKDGVKKLSDYLEEKNNEIERLEDTITKLRESYSILFDEGVISEGKKDEKIKKLEEENKRLRRGDEDDISSSSNSDKEDKTQRLSKPIYGLVSDKKVDLPSFGEKGLKLKLISEDSQNTCSIEVDLGETFFLSRENIEKIYSGQKQKGKRTTRLTCSDSGWDKQYDITIVQEIEMKTKYISASMIVRKFLKLIDLPLDKLTTFLGFLKNNRETSSVKKAIETFEKIKTKKDIISFIKQNLNLFTIVQLQDILLSLNLRAKKYHLLKSKYNKQDLVDFLEKNI